MDKDFNTVAVGLFNKIRHQFPDIILRDVDKAVINSDDVESARSFSINVDNNGRQVATITLTISDDGLTIIHSPDIITGKNSFFKNQYYNLIRELRIFAKSNLMQFNPDGDFTKSAGKRDTNNNGEYAMSESRLFGTSKTSYQNLGDSKIIVRHSAPVNFDNPAGRAHKIESIYIENMQGERFKYPYKHLNGARALAQHVAHGGNPYDSIGEHVIGLSEELSKLRMFKHYVDRNPMVSEAMSSVNTKVSDRINSVKKEINSLQSPRHYKAFAESFTEKTAVDIPEDVINDWVDRLTIRTFNEELKNVFPYIFNLLDESDIPIIEISADDLISENSEDSSDDTVASTIPEMNHYEDIINGIGEASGGLYNNNIDSQESAIKELNSLLAQPIPVGVDAVNAIQILSGIIEDQELSEVFKELSDISSEIDIRSIIKDYISIKDSENGTDILSKLNFDEEPPAEEPPAEEPPVEEPPVEEPPAEEPPVEEPPVEEPPVEEPPVAEALQHINAKQHKVAEFIRKALGSGMTLESTIRSNNKLVSLRDAISRAGLNVDDFDTDRSDDVTEELIEFVKSMHDGATGAFPKGETGVLIACQKKFGETCTTTAKRVIGELQQSGETHRMLQLAGISR